MAGGRFRGRDALDANVGKLLPRFGWLRRFPLTKEQFPSFLLAKSSASLKLKHFVLRVERRRHPLGRVCRLYAVRVQLRR